MADRNLPNRNRWIIAALVVVSVSVLAWFLDRVSGVFPGGDGADVSIAPSPGGGAAPGAGN